jgi:competence protein ComEC
MTAPALISIALAWIIPQAFIDFNVPALALIGGVACLTAWVFGGWNGAIVAMAVTGVLMRGEWSRQDRIEPTMIGHDLVVTGVICDFPKRDAGIAHFMLHTAGSRDALPGLPGQLYLSWYGVEQVPSPGEHWQLKVRLKSPRGLRNPGAFDFEAWAFAHSVGATGYVKPSVLNRSAPGDFQNCPTAGWRARVAKMITQALPENPARPYVLGLVVAATYDLRRDDWELMRKTGTTHLLAISGLNIAMVTAPVLLLGRGLQRLAPRLGLLLPAGVGVAPAIVVACLYTGLAGFGVSTVRALVMTIAATCYVAAGRRINPLDLLMIAALEVAFGEPSSLHTASFWLSFVAVAWLVLAIPRAAVTDSSASTPRRWFQRVVTEGKSLLILQLILGVGLAPIILIWFGQISTVSPLVNLIAVPVFSLWILPLCLIATAALAWTPEFGSVLMLLAADSVQFLIDSLRTLADQPWVIWEAPPVNAMALILAALGAAGLCWPRPMPGRGLAALCLLPTVLGVPPDMPARLRVLVLDVGQGLAVVLQTAGHVMVYDTGPAYRSGDAGSSVVLPVLRRMGVRKLNVLSISHPDMDHRGGAPSIAARFPDSRLIATARWGLPIEHQIACRAGLSWNWDGVRFEVLSPNLHDNRHWSENDNSCVILVSSDGMTILLPGDIERVRERDLAQRFPRAHVDLLVAPHHGSQSSSTPEFVDALKAHYVVFSTGFRNRWHFPAPKVVQRWRSSGACTLNTAETGALTFEIRGNQFQLIASERGGVARLSSSRVSALLDCESVRRAR